MATASELYLFHVTEEKADGTTSSTWMANSSEGSGLAQRNVPSTKWFTYFTKEQATELKKLLDKKAKLQEKDYKVKVTYKVMSLKSAVNYYCKRMKELMDTRQPAGTGTFNLTKRSVDSDIARLEKLALGHTIPIHI